jgi:hypothetical protein
MNLKSVLSAFLAAVGAVRQLIEQLSLKKTDPIGDALLAVQQAHQDLPAWLVPEEDGPYSELVRGLSGLTDFLSKSDHTDADILCTRYQSCLSRVYEILERLVVIAARSEGLAWLIALDAAMAVYAQCEWVSPPKPTLEPELPQKAAVKFGFRAAYLTAGGPEQSADTAAQGALDLIDKSLLECCSAIAQVCQWLEAGSLAEMPPILQRLERKSSVLAADLGAVAP